jgi:threonylcarbamoyladenosine tRNA methylthiotransferase MtaB
MNVPQQVPRATGRMRTLTLGCKVNQYETELLREGLQRAGYVDAQPDEPADVCVVNTCTVTAEGDAKSRQLIRRMARQNPGARLVVMGCYATRDPQQIAALPGVSDVITDKRELPDWMARFGVVDVPDGISRFDQRQRAYVKVQDGCLLRCSYCIIPAVRPQMHSRAEADIVAEVRRLVDNGYREVVLTGIHLGHYGVDRNHGRPREQWQRLASLLQRLCQLEGEFRIRLSSIEATEVTRQLLEVMARYSQRICPHLHVCLQSGSDRVLQAMRRRWGVQRMVDRCRLAQEFLDRPSLTTDVIVGFPGETELEFRETIAVCRELEFAKVHIFPFSPRRGTPAAEFPGQVAPEVKAARARRLSEVEQQTREAYFTRLVGRSLTVLVEGPSDDPNRVVGTTCRYAPLELTGTLAEIGQLRSATPRRLVSDHQASLRLLAE